MTDLENAVNKRTLEILAKDKKTLDEWVELEIAKLKTKEKGVSNE